jgi:hypothetical protein
MLILSQTLLIHFETDEEEKYILPLTLSNSNSNKVYYSLEILHIHRNRLK